MNVSRLGMVLALVIAVVGGFAPAAQAQTNFSAGVSPQPIVLTRGVGFENVVVTTSDPNPSISAIDYSFSRLPFGVTYTPPLQSSTAPAFPPLSFQFTASTDATPGSYVIQLNGTPACGRLCPPEVGSRTISVALIVQQSDIGATFAANPMTLCGTNAATANSVTLQPLSGYEGNPLLSFENVPSGIIITPSNPASGPVGPRTSTVPFSVQASNVAPGVYAASLRIVDRAAGIDKLVPLQIRIAQPEYTPIVSPSSVTLQAGSNPETVMASLSAGNCMDESVAVTVSSPAEIQVEPRVRILRPPYSPQAFTFQAVAGATPGIYNVSFSYVSESGVSRTATVAVRVVAAPAPDFSLRAEPGTVSMAAGDSRQINVSATGVNGFTGTINVIATVPAGATITPSSFQLTPGAVQQVTLTVAPGTGAGALEIVFTGTAAGVDGQRTARVIAQVSAAAADFTLSATPGATVLDPGATAPVAVTVQFTTGTPFPVQVTATAPSGITVTPAAFSFAAGGTQAVQIAVASDAPAGPQTIVFTATGGGLTRRTEIVVQVRQRDLTLTAAPAALTIDAGATAPASITVLLTGGASGPVQVVANAPAGITVTPAVLSFAGSGTQAINIAVGPNTPSGPHTILLTATAGDLTRTAQIVVQVPERRFRLNVSPGTLALAPGDSAPVMVSVSGVSGFVGPIAVTVSPANGLTITPSSFTVAPGSPMTVIVAANANAPVSTQQVLFTASAGGVTQTASLTVTTLPRRPVITAIAPPAVTTRTVSAVVLLTGSNFVNGATVGSTRPGLLIESTRVINANLAEVVVSVGADVTPGRYPLMLINPDGGASGSEVALLVYPADSMGAPIGVTTAAIAFPVSGTFIAHDEAVYPRGVLATTGLGTIFGEWQLDGVPFDIFTATISAGMPTEVRSHVPIPARNAGGHTLELVIRSPQYAISPAVTIVQTVDTASRLTLLSPRDASIVGRGDVFRWSLVPGAAGYEIEVDHTEGVLPRLIRVADAEWTATLAELERIGRGVRRWRVRPVLAGEVRGEPTRWSRFVVLPERVTLVVSGPALDPNTGRHHVRWTGGYPGLVYRVEFLDAAGQVVHQALTIHQEYVLPRSTAERLGRLSVRVTPVMPNGATIGDSNTSIPQASRLPRRGDIHFAQNQLPPQLLRQDPADGSTVETTQPVLHVEWRNPVDPDSIALTIDAVDVTAVSDITPVSVRHQTLLPLAPGLHRAVLTAGQTTTTWQFTVREPAMVAPPEVVVPVAPDAPAATTPETPASTSASKPLDVRGDWTVMPIGTIAATSGPGVSEVRAQVTGQGDVSTGADVAAVKASGDLSIARQLEDPRRTLSDNRNWLGLLRLNQGVIGEELTAGYNIPSIFDQAQLLTLGLARGGALGTIKSRAGALSYYQAFDSNAGAGITSYFNPPQDVRAFAYETPFDRNRILFRVVSLSIDEGPGAYSNGGKGRSLGLFTRFAIGKSTNITFEAARGEFDPGPDSLEETREGNALSMRLDGYFGRYSYRADLRNTAAGFVNPANRGLTPASVADRRSADVSLTRMFGTSVVTADVRYLTGASSSGVSGPGSSEAGGKLSLANFSIGRRLTLGGSVNMTNSQSGALETYGLPATDRSLRGGELTLATSGRIQVSQSVSYQQTLDNDNPINDLAMTNLTFAVNGTLFRNTTLSAIASGIRSKPRNSFAGTTDILVLSLNPAVAIPGAALAFRPSVTYSRSENSAYDAFTSETTSYSAGVQWDPTWFGNVLSLQVSTSWADTETGTIRMTTDPTYSASLTLRKAIGRGPAMPSSTTLPGATPIGVPEAATSNPIQGSTPVTTNPK